MAADFIVACHIMKEVVNFRLIK